MRDVKVCKINYIKPIENADAIELAIVGGWPCVVSKNKYKVGDLVTYCPVDSIIPEDILKSIGLEGKLSGSKKNRVKAVRLRGQLSVGILLDVPEWAKEGESLAKFYNIEKYEEPIPPQLAGKSTKHPEYFIKYDVENLNNEIDMFTKGEDVVVLTKIHGSHIAFGYVREQFYVSSRNITLIEDDKNVYWNVARKFKIEEKLKELFRTSGQEIIYLHGEVLPTQDFSYGRTELDLMCFDIRYGNNWLSWDEFVQITDHLIIPRVPVDYIGPFDLDLCKELASGPNTIGGKHCKEGVVIRPIKETTFGHHRKIAKLINPEYLLRRGGTELH